jgi:parallel beta-helix repeat protein
MKKLMLILGLALFLCLNGVNAATYDCSSCSGCSDYIQNSSTNDIVQLTQDITGVSGSCVEYSGSDNITFDCQGNTIDGDKTGTDYAIRLTSNSNNNIVMDCVNLTNFYAGIQISVSSNNTLTNNTANNNTGMGLYLSGADDNNITNTICNNNSVHGIRLDFNSENNALSNVTASNNVQHGIQVDGDYNKFTNITVQNNLRNDLFIYAITGDYPCQNNYTNIIGSGDRLIEVYNYTTTIQDKTLSELILCDANDSVVDNVTIIGSSSVYNNALMVVKTDNVTVNDINSSGNRRGVYLLYSSNITVSNSTVNSNNQDGITIRMSGNNRVINVTSRFNGNGINLYYSGSILNTIMDSIFDENSIGVYIITAGNNTLTNITVRSNTQYGVNIFRNSDYNTINDSYIENSTQYGFYFEHITTDVPEYNLVYNNYINNSDNYRNSTNMTNYFNTTLSLNTNILGGPYLGGNYWTNSSGSDYSDTCTNLDGDGICDTGYGLDSDNFDYLPLTLDSGPPIFLDAQVNTTLGNTTIKLNLTVTDGWGLEDTVLFGINSTNYTYTGNNSDEFYLEFDCVSEGGGYYTWNITWANDTSGNLNYTIGDNLPLNFTCDLNAPSNTSTINETNVTYNSAIITWQTDELAIGLVYLDTNETNLTSGYSLLNVTSNSTYSSNITVYLTNLTKQTLYYYNVSFCDQAGNCNSSGVYNFTTLDCTENWQYSVWSACVSGAQTRTATDQNSCGTTDNRSTLSQSCGGGPTGGFSPPSTTSPPTVGEKNASRRPTLVPGVGLRNNTKLQTAIQKVLQISNMSENAIQNMLRLSESITSQFNVTREIKIVNQTSALTTKIKFVGSDKIKDFMFYDTIPKDFASDISNITLTAIGVSYEVVEEDPELVFFYSEFDPEEEITITYTVNEDTGISVIDDFESEVYAYESDGTDITTVCVPDSKRCYESQIQECKSDGSDWQTLEQCTYGCMETGCNPEPWTGWTTVIIALVIIVGIIIVGLYFFGFLKTGKKKDRKHFFEFLKVGKKKGR